MPVRESSTCQHQPAEVPIDALSTSCRYPLSTPLLCLRRVNKLFRDVIINKISACLLAGTPAVYLHFALHMINIYD